MKLDMRVINTLELGEGQQIADLGAGNGDASMQFAEIVGKTGNVFAIDTNSRALSRIRKKNKRKAGRDNITLVLADENSGNLPENSVDIVFSKNTFHHLTKPESVFKNLRKALKPGGKVFIIDFKEKSGFISLIGHCSTKEHIDSVMAKAGFTHIDSYIDLPKQHFFVYT